MDGQTPLTIEEQLGLLIPVVSRHDLDSLEQENILEARKWIMNRSILRRYNVLSEEFLCKLHKKMYGHVWEWAGSFRRSDKNIGVEFFNIPIELKILLDDAQLWLNQKTLTIEQSAVMFHHRLVKIHLFPNGNGRHARLCADILVAQHNAKKLSWGGDYNLTNQNDVRKRYINALKEADYGDYSKLFEFAINC